MYRTLVVATVLAGSVAHAEPGGVYFSQSLGVGRARGDLEPMVGNAMRTRVSIGARVRWLAIEPWMTADLQTDRDGAWRGVIGGEPAMGRSDLAWYGVDAKLIAPVARTSNATIESYVRIGGSIVEATGSLDGYRGHAIGAGYGIQLSGKVRALGFLWAPLFLIGKGPKITGSLFLDQGLELATLSHPSAPTLSARIGHVTMGFAVGTRF